MAAAAPDSGQKERGRMYKPYLPILSGKENSFLETLKANSCFGLFGDKGDWESQRVLFLVSKFESNKGQPISGIDFR
jgi:hypothetical protein